MLEYGRGLNIPNDQLDFIPQYFKDEEKYLNS